MSTIFSQINTSIFTFTLAGLLFFSACSSSDDESAVTGKSLGATLTEEQMIEIFSDLHLAEGLTQIQPKAEKDSSLQVIYHQIFESHGLTEEEFDKNMSIYFSDPVVADELYSRVVEHLSTLEAKSVDKKIGKDGPAPKLEEEQKLINRKRN